MEMFLSGPPGGLALPYTHTRLSDLDGGVYGPGASVASTGMNVVKPAVKAGFAQAAGETWEDLLEYYMVRIPRRVADVPTHPVLSSSTPIVARWTLRTSLARSFIKGASTRVRVG